MRTNLRSVILAISLLFTLAASISAVPGDLDLTEVTHTNYRFLRSGG